MAIKFTQVVDLGNQRITSLGSPSVATDAVNKSYVDSVAQGLDWKASVKASPTGNVDLSSPGGTFDGVTMSNGDRFLAMNQTTGNQNGIYVWNGATSAATRATDADSSTKVSSGMAVTVEQGTVNGDKVWILVTDNVTLGTTALVFTQLGGGAGTTYSAGAGLTLTGTTFAVGQGTGVIVSGSTVSLDTNYVTRKYAANVGDGSASSIQVTHNLGTRDVVVQVYTNGAPYDTVFCGVERTDANSVTLSFGTAPASAAYRVVVEG